MESFEEIRNRTMRGLDSLVLEIGTTFERIVLPEWGGGALHGMGRTAYGYVMNCMAFVDLLSVYATSWGKAQTRMVSFLRTDVGYAALSSRVLVQLWRHTLFHTAQPMEIAGSRSGARYSFLLQWGEPHLPRAQHMVFVDDGDRRILGLGVVFLAEDVQAAATRYFERVADSGQLRRELEETRLRLVQRQRFMD